MTSSLVLASASPFRRALLENAGLRFSARAAQINERVLERPLEEAGAPPAEVALALAEAKARDVSRHFDGAIVIGSDQTMSLGLRVYHKPKDMAEAAEHLLSLSGRTHSLNSAIVLVRDGDILWRHVSTAHMTVRLLDRGFIERHLHRVGEMALSSVGAYQFEGEGIQLFEKIEGDYFTILGLPMLPLLEKLRELGSIDA
ncbi:septum formation protein Maf [Sinorhizobium fredii USDA 205]|uniref:7-methyl-GTP pyrophosphatase n=1 Tax=Rhizobium fredii TaxID=380 RepID=A0A844A793_RHIFR|nr:Maf-like protein [Sinorhizobium fredii]AWM27014.1 Septum formation protein Maf [Sinorhizobium fredii CCBAU 25509]KSV86467.1 septum formation protein Maf [Sinorhizobium fredii USDA 205]MQX08803.1 Maf-like protein [Sinorhizobium fredii]GEC32507.1 Maf-like protein [Sinorhizobium fredii]GLS09807.1 Maf-like protein [Sinorhizobium fredii]